MSWRDRTRRYWPHIRAILILLHMAAVLTLCAPPKHKVLRHKNWEGVKAEANFCAWSSRFRSIGIEMTPEEAKQFWRGVAEKYISVREFIGWPADHYANRLYLGQGWSLFSSPKRKPALVVVDIHENGEWRTIYRNRSDEFTWRRTMFDNNRMRKLVGRISRSQGSTGLYFPLAAWLARLAAKDFPGADKLRTRLWRYETAPPGVDFDPNDGKFTDVRVWQLEPHR